jgi:hypothetical protein
LRICWRRAASTARSPDEHDARAGTESAKQPLDFNAERDGDQPFWGNNDIAKGPVPAGRLLSLDQLPTLRPDLQTEAICCKCRSLGVGNGRWELSSWISSSLRQGRFQEKSMKARALLCLLLFASGAANARAADVTGRWKVTISLGGATMTGVALLKQAGDEVTGSIGPDERNQHPLDGVVKGNRVTLTTHPRPGRTVAFDKCYLTVYREKMTGTTERKGSNENGRIEFSRPKQ